MLLCFDLLVFYTVPFVPFVCFCFLLLSFRLIKQTRWSKFVFFVSSKQKIFSFSSLRSGFVFIYEHSSMVFDCDVVIDRQKKQNKRPSFIFIEISWIRLYNSQKNILSWKDATMRKSIYSNSDSVDLIWLLTTIRQKNTKQKLNETIRKFVLDSF